MAVLYVEAPRIRAVADLVFVGDLHCDPLSNGETYPIWLKVDRAGREALKRALERLEVRPLPPPTEIGRAALRAMPFPLLSLFAGNLDFIGICFSLNFERKDLRP